MANPPKKMPTPSPVLSPTQQLEEDARGELEQAQKELKEIDVLIQQTSAEVERLAQRNAQAAGHLKQLEVALDTVPRADLQGAYTTAMDAQKRLFMMRGQLIKHQNMRQSNRQ